MRKAAAMRRQAVFLDARHFAKRTLMAVRQEHRVIAKALVAARRPNQHAINLSLEILAMTVRPSDAQRRDEMRLAPVRRRGPALAQLVFDRLHGAAEILVGSGPAGRGNSRCTGE